MIEIESLVLDKRVTVDPYAVLGVAEEVRVGSPGVWAVAVRDDGPAPKMFANGMLDVPTFTASGIDPGLLLRLPYRCRHWAAAEPDRAAVHGLFETVDEYSELRHEGLDAAVNRVRAWAMGRTGGARHNIDEAQVLRDLFG